MLSILFIFSLLFPPSSSFCSRTVQVLPLSLSLFIKAALISHAGSLSFIRSFAYLPLPSSSSSTIFATALLNLAASSAVLRHCLNEKPFGTSLLVLSFLECCLPKKKRVEVRSSLLSLSLYSIATFAGAVRPSNICLKCVTLPNIQMLICPLVPCRLPNLPKLHTNEDTAGDTIVVLIDYLGEYHFSCQFSSTRIDIRLSSMSAIFFIVKASACICSTNALATKLGSTILEFY